MLRWIMTEETPAQHLTFSCRLERIAETAEYFAFKIPTKVTAKLGTRGPVPVSVRLNGKVDFMVSLAPLGGGRHLLRVKRSAREAAGITEGDRVRVEITVHQHSTPMPIPPDLTQALQADGVLEAFKLMTLGKRKMVIDWINEAAKPETRARRIQRAVGEALGQKERLFERQARAAKAKGGK
jgi:hypothetical protein